MTNELPAKRSEKHSSDLLSHGVHKILPLVLTPPKMPVHVEFSTASPSTRTCEGWKGASIETMGKC